MHKFFYNHLFYVIFYILFYTLSGHAEQPISEINSFKQVEDYLKLNDSLQEGTLLVLDIDDVLITPEDLICKSENKKAFERFIKPITDLPEKEQIKFLSIILSGRKVKRVEHSTVEILKRLEEKGIKIIALTNGWTGEYGIISSLENLKLKELKNLGYDFSNTFIDLPSKKFTNFSSKDPKRFPVYKKGVLWTCNLPKGEVLSEFLKYAKYKPKKIIFIDDKVKHLTSVEEYCKKNNIEFQGFQYKNLSANTSSIDEKIVKIQIDNLIKKKSWISDKMAKLIK